MPSWLAHARVCRRLVQPLVGCMPDCPVGFYCPVASALASVLLVKVSQYFPITSVFNAQFPHPRTAFAPCSYSLWRPHGTRMASAGSTFLELKKR